MSTREDLAIETSRLLMRPISPDDADEWWQAIWNDPDVTRYLPTRKPIPRKEVSARIERAGEGWRTRGIGIWSIREKTHASLVGHCGLVVNEPPDVELIYALARSAWGRGLATEAARSMVTFAFERRGVDELLALVFPENTASAHVLEKLGFVLKDETVRFGAQLLRYSLRKS